ncbi:hypothetical protein [Sinimarinibacterium sp. CAU 1509]|uniref:hypothetical protein n=1 Tax=Sinimarinibacterium sp. CAU 1509 TaxID=2562283 RepID=UPI001B7FDA13|nr:hypothetical protein [Sinimarinibacterium sp. CAU 1509]
MRKIFLLLTMAALGAAPALHADVLTLPEAESATPAAPSSLPQRGMTMNAVTRQFGEPLQRHAPAGGGGPKTPPITRWDYDGFSVFFENSTVIDIVVKDAPAPLSHVDELSDGP